MKTKLCGIINATGELLFDTFQVLVSNILSNTSSIGITLTA